LKVAQKILGDYKVLLEYPPNRFWATISYNLNLQNSLDLFIRYAPRKHFLIEPLHLTGYYGTIVKEIFRSVFAIYLRLIDLEQEDAVLFD
jgi:activating signal cointegrator complex subunit 2